VVAKKIKLNYLGLDYTWQCREAAFSLPLGWWNITTIQGVVSTAARARSGSSAYKGEEQALNLKKRYSFEFVPQSPGGKVTSWKETVFPQRVWTYLVVPRKMLNLSHTVLTPPRTVELLTDAQTRFGVEFPPPLECVG